MTKLYHYTTFDDFVKILKEEEILAPREKLLDIVEPERKRELERRLQFMDTSDSSCVPLNSRNQLPNGCFELSISLELEGRNYPRISLDRMVDVGVVWGLGARVKRLLKREHDGKYKDVPVYRIY